MDKSNNQYSANRHSLVSVVIPCFNYGHFLPEALESVLLQQYQHWECIIVDDGSTDDTPAVAREWMNKDKRFQYILQENKGLPAARNRGVQESRGELIQFLDSDDMIAPGKLARQCEYMQQHPQTDIVYGNGLFFQKDIKAQTDIHAGLPAGILKGMKPEGGRGKQVLPQLVKDNFLEISCALVRRKVVEKVAFDRAFTAYEDWHFWIRCALEDHFFHYLPLPGTETFIRTGHQSMMSDSRTMTANGIRIRKYLSSHLSDFQKIYNAWRLWKLLTRKTLRIY